MPKFYEPADDNPIVTGGLKRRAAADADLSAPTAPMQAEDPFKGNWMAETARSQGQRVANYVPALGGLGRQLLGDQTGAMKDYAEFTKGEQRAHDLGPAVQSFDDAKKAGGGVGDYASALGYQAAAFVPDVALAVTGGGIGADVAGGMARRAAMKGIANEIEDRAVNVAARTAAKTEAAAAAEAAPDAVQGVQAATRVAHAQIDEASRKAAMEGAAEISGRTPRIVKTVETAQKAGGLVGGAAGFYPATVSGSVDALKETDQAGAAKIGGVDAAASLIGSLPFGKAFEVMAPAARDAATAAIEANAKRFLPTLLKDTAKHSVAGGAAGVAMTATQLAGHKWVDDNVDLMGPDALEKYMDSFVGGAIAAGGMHAGGHVSGKASEFVRNGLGDTLGKFKESAKATLAKYGERARKLRAKDSSLQPGQEMGAGGPDGSAPIPSGLIDMLRRHKDTVLNAGKQAMDSGVVGKAKDAIKSVADTAKGHLDNLHFDAELDHTVNELSDSFEKGGPERIPGRLRAPNQPNPIELGGMKDHVMSYIKADSPVWMDKATANYVAKPLEKLITGQELTANDVRVHNMLVDSGALSQKTIDGMALVGKHWGEETARAAKVHAEADPVPDGEKPDVLPEEANRAPLAEQVASHRLAVRNATERVGKATSPDAKAAAIEERRNANKDYMAAQQGLRDHLLGEKTYKNPYGKNVINEKLSEKHVYDAKIAEPGRVELEQKGVFASRKHGDQPLRLALSVDSLAAKEIGKNSEAYQNLEPAERGKAALIRVFGDLLQAGVKIKPESITAGDLGHVGNIYLGELTHADVAHLKGMVRTGLKLETKPGVSSRALRTEGSEKAKDSEFFTKDKTQGEDELAPQDLHKLAPREVPPGTEAQLPAARTLRADGRGYEPGKGAEPGFVPHEGVVGAVKINDHAGYSARDARAAHRNGETGPNGEDPRVLVGKEIGREVLARELAAGRNERRHAALIKRLEDPESGLAVKFYKEALAGKHDDVHVSERKVDNEKIDGKAAKVERATKGEVVPKMAESDALEADLNAADAATEAAQKATVLARGNAVPESKAPARKPPAEGKMTPAVEFTKAQLRSQALKAEHDKAQALRDAKSNFEATGKGDNPLALKEHLSFDKELESAGSSKPGEHDHKAETKMLNDVLARLGIKTKVSVGPLIPKAGPHIGGAYNVKSSHIMINDNLHGAERVEVLLHEVGHHIIADTIAKARGVDVKSLEKLSPIEALDALRESNPELHDALGEDYMQWRMDNTKGNPRVSDVRGSRQPFHRTMGSMSRGAFDGKRLDDLSAQNREYQYDAHEWFADNIAKALAGKTETQSVIGKFFGEIATKLRAAYDMIFSTPEMGKFKAAPSVDKWVQGMLDANVAAVREATGVTVPVESAKPVIEAAVGDAARRGRDYHPESDPAARAIDSQEHFDALKEFIRTTMPNEARAILDRVMDRPAALKVLRTLNADNPEFMRMLDDAHEGIENRIAMGYMAWKDGKFRTGPNGEQAFMDVSDNLAAVLKVAGEGDLAQRVFSDIANGSIQRIVDARGKDGYDVRQLESQGRSQLQKVVNWTAKHSGPNAPLSKFWDSQFARARSSSIPAWNKLANTIQRRQGTTGEGAGMNPAIVHTLARFEKQTRLAVGHLTRREQASVMDMLQRQMTPEHPKWASKSDAVKKGVADVRKLMDDSFAYLRKAGVNVGNRENFFPVVIDLRNEKAKDDLFHLYNQPEKFEAAIRKAKGHWQEDHETGDKNWVPSTKPFPELVRAMVNGAIDEHGYTAKTGSDAPNFRGMNHRISNFVYEHGDAADVKKFASLQSKDASEVFGRYLGPMVKRAEYARHFGPKGEVKEKMLADMRAQGATEAQVTEAENAIKASLGTYGAEGSPTLRAMSPALADKLNNQKTRDFINGAQAYQNTRVLPLALLSSLVDPMGIAMRSGGDFKVAWDGFREGIKAIHDKSTKAELHQMLEQLGAADDTLFILQSGFGGANANGLANKVNEAVFRMNGMEKWVTNTRYQALLAAHGFLVKHANGAFNAHSQRYLQELGLEPGDVVPELQTRPDGSTATRVKLLDAEGQKTATPAERAKDEKVRNALRMFVDEAILRPNSQQRPLWHNDPYMGLVSQYKAFGYALYDQIGGRFAREMQHGNMGVIGAALGYLPVTIVAELMREMIQYGPSGNPNRDDWGPGDYASMWVQRTGLTGPKFQIISDTKGDVERKNLPGTSQLGPTIGQASNVVDAFEGKRELGKEAQAAAPGSTLYQHWDDDKVAAANDDQPTQQRGAKRRG